jgi:hypothetical protein
MKKSGGRHRPYRQDGKPDPDALSETLPETAPNKSWQTGQPGQGGEGLSKGYGGPGSNAGGPSGPEREDRASQHRRSVCRGEMSKFAKLNTCLFQGHIFNVILVFMS